MRHVNVCSSPSSARVHSADRSSAGTGQQVLLVDDDPVVLLTTEHILRRLGYEVVSYTDPGEALAAARNDPAATDVLITDFDMPEISGLDLAGELLEMLPALPVVVITGFLSEEVRKRAAVLGVGIPIQKENVFEELADAINTALRKASGR